MSAPHSSESTSIVLWQALAIQCPECKEEIPVPIHVSHSPDAWFPETIMMSCTPDLSAVWHHAFKHVVGRANDSTSSG